MALLRLKENCGWTDQTIDSEMELLATELAKYYDVGYAQAPVMVYDGRPCVMMSRKTKTGTILELASELNQTIVTMNDGKTRTVFLYQILFTQAVSGPETVVRFGVL